MTDSLINCERGGSVVAELLGGEVGRVSRLAGSVANQDFLIESAGEPRLVVKAGPDAEIAAEAWACAHLATIGAPVPRVVVSELDPATLGLPFLVMEFVAGEPSSDADVVGEAGSWFRRLHQAELPGWGPVTVETGAAGGAGVGGRYTLWREAIEADLAGLAGLVDNGVLDEKLADAVHLSVGVPGLLHYDGPGVLLHNDVKPAHLLGRSDRGRRRLSGIIDWGDAAVGDPTAEIARLSMSGPAVTAAFLDGYGVVLTDELADRLVRYRILWNVRALDYEFQAGGDWFDTYRNRIEKDVQLLG